MGWNLNPQGNCGGSWALVRDDEGRRVSVVSGAAIHLESGRSLRVCSLCFLSCISCFLLLNCGCGHCPLRATAAAVLPGATVITHQESSGSGRVRSLKGETLSPQNPAVPSLPAGATCGRMQFCPNCTWSLETTPSV